MRFVLYATLAYHILQKIVCVPYHTWIPYQNYYYRMPLLGIGSWANTQSKIFISYPAWMPYQNDLESSYHAWMPLVGSIVKSCPADRAVCVVGVSPVAEQQLAHLKMSVLVLPILEQIKMSTQFCQKRKVMYLYFNKSLFCSKEKPSVAIAVCLIDILTILKPSPNLATKKITSQI